MTHELPDNPMTVMQHNVVRALEECPLMRRTGAQVLQWLDPRTNIAEASDRDLRTWCRVETTNVSWQFYWANNAVQYTQTLNVTMALPTRDGLRQTDILKLADAVAVALIPLRMGQLAKPCPELEGFTMTGGDLALADSSDPKREAATGNWRWSKVASIQVELIETIAQLMARGGFPS